MYHYTGRLAEALRDGGLHLLEPLVREDHPAADLLLVAQGARDLYCLCALACAFT